MRGDLEPRVPAPGPLLPFERVRWVTTLPADVDRRELGLVMHLEATGVVRIKLPIELVRTLLDELDDALAQFAIARALVSPSVVKALEGEPHCAARPNDGGSGDGSSPPPTLVELNPKSTSASLSAALTTVVVDAAQMRDSARLRGAIDRGRGRGAHACPYSVTELALEWRRGFEEAGEETPR